jgi:hypothetical protein
VRRPTPAELDLSPAQRMAAWAHDIGAQAAARTCGEVLDGSRDEAAVLWLGGKPATNWQYEPWPRTWALRGLLYVWDDSVMPAVLAALTDEGWRVREMAAKVVVRRELPASHLLEPLLSDDVPRVRVAALRGLGAVGEAEDATAVRAALDDSQAQVADAASAALTKLGRRLDRPL